MPLTPQIESVREKFTGRSSEFTDVFSRAYTRVFEVITTSESVGPTYVEFAPGVPRVWEFYAGFALSDSDPLAVCRRVRAEQNADDPLLWEVVCEYSTSAPAVIGSQSAPSPPGMPGQGGGPPGMSQPELRLPKFSWTHFEQSLPLYVDLDGDPVVNSAGDPVEYPQVPYAFAVLTVERYQVSFDQELYAQFAYAINRDPFLFATSHQVRCAPITGETEQIGNTLYWRVRFQFQFWPEELEPGYWCAHVQDVGLRERVDGAMVNVLDSHNTPVTRPVPLLGGVAMTAGVLESQGPSVLEFKAYREKDFSLLNLF